MKIINLIEDTAGAPFCRFEHGLSFYIETEHRKILVDAGASDAFIYNAEQKGVDLRAVDAVVISHGHYDHTGGLFAFSKINPTAKIYINKNAVGEFYNLKSGTPKYIGMDKAVLSLPNVIFTEGDFRIDEGLSVFTCKERRFPLFRGNRTLTVKRGESFEQDEFDHEQYLVVSEGEKRVLISGCAHNGILNILEACHTCFGVEPTHVISGFHTALSEYTPEDDRLTEQTAKALKETDCLFYSGHCTGEHPLQIFKSILGERLTVLRSGDCII